MKMGEAVASIAIDGVVHGPGLPKKTADGGAAAAAGGGAAAAAGGDLGLVDRRIVEWAMPALVLGTPKDRRVPVPPELRGRDLILLERIEGAQGNTGWTARRARPTDVMTHVIFPTREFCSHFGSGLPAPPTLSVPPRPGNVISPNWGSALRSIVAPELAAVLEALEADVVCSAGTAEQKASPPPGPGKKKPAAGPGQGRRRAPVAAARQIRPRRVRRARAVDVPSSATGDGVRYLVNSYSVVSSTTEWSSGEMALTSGDSGDDAGAPATAAAEAPYETRIGAFGNRYRSINIGGAFVWRRVVPALLPIARQACSDRGAFVPDEVLQSVAEEADLAIRQAVQYLQYTGARVSDGVGRSTDTRRAMVDAMLVLYSVSRGASSSVVRRADVPRVLRRLREYEQTGKRALVTERALGMRPRVISSSDPWWSSETAAAAHYLVRVARRQWMAYLPQKATDVSDPWHSALRDSEARGAPRSGRTMPAPSDLPPPAWPPRSQTVPASGRSARAPPRGADADPRGWTATTAAAAGPAVAGRWKSAVARLMDMTAHADSHYRWKDAPGPAVARALTRRFAAALGPSPVGADHGPVEEALSAMSRALELHETLGQADREVMARRLLELVVAPLEEAWEYEDVTIQALRDAYEVSREAKKLSQMAEYASYSAADRIALRNMRKGDRR